MGEWASWVIPFGVSLVVSAMSAVYGYSRLVSQVAELTRTVDKICKDRESDALNGVAGRVAIASIQADLAWIKKHIAQAPVWPYRKSDDTGGG